MYTDADNTPTAGPSTKSYAQALKDSPPPRTEAARDVAFDAVLVNREDEQWSDVSSVTSCAWPGSVGTESVVSTDSPNPRVSNNTGNTHAHIADEEILDDVYWIDEEMDTRVPHALAGQIKHINRSRWLYTNIGRDACLRDIFKNEPSWAEKPWRRFPGCRDAYWHRDHHRIERNESKDKRNLHTEVREAKKSWK